MPIWTERPNPRRDPISLHYANYSPAKDDFDLGKCVAHVARKGRFKSIGHGLFVSKGYKSRSRSIIEGNNANERYHRATYESSQRISAAMWASTYRATRGVSGGQNLDLSDDPLVKARFYRQDNLRFNREFENPAYGLSKGNQRAVKCSRWAHYFNGVTELGAAPTGMQLKFSKLLTMPKRNEKSMGSQLRVCVALVLICAAVGGMAKGITKSVKPGADLLGPSIRADILALAASFSAITAAAAFCSLAAGAVSCMMTTCSTLSPTLMKRLQANQDKHLHRLYLLINDVKDKPNATHMLSVALKKKIPGQFCDGSGKPVLLSRLIENVKGANNPASAKQAMKTTIGAYLTECDASGDKTNKLLDPEQNKAELLQRENHVVALTNMIEHVKIDKSASHNLNDIRTRADVGVEKYLRRWMISGASGLTGLMGFTQVSKSISHWNSEEFQNQRNLDRADPKYATRMRYCAENILDNPHQYGPLTRTLANLSEGLRVFNHGVLLSLNYQLTRPFAQLAGGITERVFEIPNSRVTSFSIGRLVASTAWATFDAFILLSLAAGNGVSFSGPDSGTKVVFPLQLVMGAVTLPISIVSTAAQMILVAIPAATLMLAAKGAARLEGWEGDISASTTGTNGKRREALRWA
jgi:hypothetical protein